MPYRVVAGSLLCLSLLSGPAAAGDAHPAAGAPWHQQHPWFGTGVGFYYSQHPDHIPAWPRRLSGYAVPIYETMKPVVHVVRRHRVRFSAHVEWCAARYRSYDVRSDTWQPNDGLREYCRSPYL